MIEKRTYQYDSLHKIPDLPGLYCWYLKITNPSLEILREYFNIFQSAKYQVTVKGDFNFDYKAALENQSNKLIDNDHKYNLDEEMLSLLFDTISQPIYIGHAKKSLLDRIGTHKRKIDDARFETLDTEAIDIEERTDNVFASRISKYIDNTSLKTKNLSVQIFHYPEGIDADRIKSLVYCEHYFNRVIKPILGKK